MGLLKQKHIAMPDVMTTNNALSPDRKVKPKEDVTIYATAALKDIDGIGAGDPMVVHTALAEKLVASGKATKNAPTDKASK